MKYLLNEYKLSSPKIVSNTDIVCISDIHSDVAKLKEIRNILAKLKISTLLISGDLVDSTNDVRNDELYKIIKSISLFSSVYISKGNHDLVRFDSNRKEIAIDDNKFFNELSKLDNVKVFNKKLESIYLSKDINLSALNMPINWYKKGENESAFERIVLNNLDVNIDKFNILLSHTPNGFIRNNNIKQSLNYFKDMNLILCGHIHGGLMPVFLRGKNNHRGLVGPYASLFPKSAYGIYQNDDSSLLVSGGVTKVSNSSEFGRFSGLIDNIYPAEIELIHLTNGSNQQLKLCKKHVHL